MSDVISIPRKELEKLEERVRQLTLEKSHFRRSSDLMCRLSEVPGLQNTVEAIPRLVAESIGGAHVALYYLVADQLHCVDALGDRELSGTVADPLVRQAFEQREFVEETPGFDEAKMLTYASTEAPSWAMPLLVGEQLVGVLKAEGMLMAAAEVRSQLQPFFGYAALVLKNEIESHLQLTEARRYAAIVQSSDDAIIGKTTEGVITSWNRGAEKIYGYAEHEAVGRSITFLTPPEREDEASRILDQLKRGQAVDHYETIRRRKDGRDIHVSLTVSPIKNAAGDVIGASTIARDITERIRAEEELRRVNRALRILSDSNQAVIRSTEEAGLLNEICRILVEVGGYRMAWVGYAEHDEAKTVRPAAHAGIESGYLETARITWADTERGRGPGGMAIRTGQLCIARNIPTDPAFAPWREEAIRRGYQSIIALPLASEGQALGALGIYAGEANAFDARETEILTELASDLAYGITALRTRLAHARAEASQQLFRELANQSNDTIFVVDPPTGRVLDANDTACRALGYAREELLHRSVTDFDCTMQDSTRWAEHVRALQTAGALTLESRHRREDGTTFPVEVGVRYTVLDQKEYLIAVVRDITERKRVEEELRQAHQQRERLVLFNEALLSAIPTPVFYKDREGRYLGCNRAFTEVMGLTSEELKGKTVFELWPDEHAHTYHQKDLELMANPALQRYEFKVRDKNGALRPVIYVKDVFRDEENQIAGIVGAFLDITERQRAEDELRESEERYRDLYENAPNVYFSVTLDGIVRRCNRRAGELLGYAVEDLVGRPVKELYADTPQGREKAAQVLARFQAGEVVRDEELQMQTAAGRPVWVSLTVGSVRDELGHVVESRSMVVDITERKRAEEALRRREADLQLALEAGRLGDWHWNIVTGEVTWSARCKALYGLPPDTEITYERFLAAVHPDDRERTAVALRRAVDTRADYEVEKRVVWPDGLVRWTASRGRVFCDAAGQPSRMSGVTMDITGRKQAEATREALLSLEAGLSEARTPVEAARTVFATADQLWDWDSGALDLYSPEEDRADSVLRVDVVGGQRREVLSALVSGEPSPRMRRALREGPELILRAPPIERPTDSVPFGDTARPSASIMCVPLRRKGQPIGVLSVQSYTPNAFTKHDLRTLQGLADHCGGALERIRAAAALRESEARYRELILHQAEGLGIVDLQERFTFANPAGEAIFGVPNGNLVGRTLREFTTDAQYARILAQTEKRRAGERSTYEMEIVRPDGEIRCLWVSAVPQSDAAGRFTGTLGLFMDITERKQAEAELLKLNQELDRRVRDRTAELEFKNEELARMNKLFIGRELRMVELKERIRVLEAEEVGAVKPTSTGKDIA